MDSSNSSMLQYGFSSLDDEIAKDQMDAENVFRSESSNLEPPPITGVSLEGEQRDRLHDSRDDADGASADKAVQEKRAVSGSASRNRKRKPTKGLRDENAPKLPQTGYVMFMTERRDAIKAENPNITFPELTKKIASEWSSMSTDTKKIYLDKAEENKAKYMEELVAYKQTDAYRTFEKKKRQAESEPTKTTMVTPQPGVVPSKESQPKLPGLDVPIFTEEFLEYNKGREKELRELRKLNTQYEEQNAILSKHVDELRKVIKGLEDESNIQRNNNIALVQHLESLRETLSNNFVSVPLPDTNEVPTVATIDTYMTKLHRLILESPQENEELIAAVRDVVNKLNLEAYVT